MRSDCWIGLGFYFGIMKMGTRQRWWSYNIVKALKATELYTFKWLILYYMHFTSVKQNLPLYTFRITFLLPPLQNTGDLFSQEGYMEGLYTGGHRLYMRVGIPTEKRKIK